MWWKTVKTCFVIKAKFAWHCRAIFSCLLFCPACPNFSAHMGTFGLVSNLEASQLNFHTDQETKLPMFYAFDSVGWLAFKTQHSLLRCWDTTFEPSSRPTPFIKCWRCLGARAKNLVRIWPWKSVSLLSLHWKHCCLEWFECTAGLLALWFLPSEFVNDAAIWFSKNPPVGTLAKQWEKWPW